VIGNIWTWALAHPWIAIGVLASTLASIANVLTRHYGDDNPRLKRALLFIIDLLSLVPSRDSPARGLKVPGLSLSAPPESALRKLSETVGK